MVKKTPSHKKTVKITKQKLVPIKGDKARRYRILGTKKIISRRQADKILRPAKTRRPLSGKQAQAFARYLHVRDDYIEAQRGKGKKLTKREAMNSEGLKSVIRDLKSKDPMRKAKALAKTGRITKDQIVLYAEKFSEG